MKRIITLLIAAAMMLSLVACGSSGKGATGSEKVSAVATPAPEFVYKAGFTEVDVGPSTDFSVRAMSEDGFYAAKGYAVEGEIPEGVTPQYDGQYDRTEYSLSYFSYDGSETVLSNYSSLEPMECPDGWTRTYEYTFISALAVNSEGNIQTIENRNISCTDNPELTYDDADYDAHQQYLNEYWVRVFDKTGTELSRALVETPDDSFYPSSVLDSEGNFLCPDNTSIIAIGPDGSSVYSVDMGDSYTDTLIKSGDTPYAVSWGMSGGMELIPIENRTAGTPVEFAGYNYPVTGGGDYQFYYTDGVNFKGFNPDEEPVKLFSWLDCGISSSESYNNNTTVLKDGTVVTVTYDYEDGVAEIAKIAKVPYDPSAVKKELTLGAISLPWDAEQAIIDFNKNNDGYKITVVSYYDSSSDWESAVEKMKTEIIAGNMPDIIYLAELPVKQLASKGFLEDLTPFIQNDNEIELEDLFPNVLNSVKYNDRIISTVSGFSVQTVIGAARVVGDEPGWNYDEFRLALSNMPDGCEPFDSYMTREIILRNCLDLDMNDFVNWQTGEVNFMNDEFYDLLEFAKSFPEEYNWEDYEYESTEQRIAQGKQMCMFGYMSDFDNILYEGSMFGNSSITYVGLPTNNGVGNMLSVNPGYAISSTCSDKEAAWQFIRQYMTEDYMEDQYLFPVSMKLFNEKLEKAKQTEYEKDANGNYILDSEGNKKPVARVSYTLSDGTEVARYCLDDELADKVKEIVYNTDKIAAYDEEINEIVMNHAEAYFSGQKSAQDVAKLIQSQVSIYVNEQR